MTKDASKLSGHAWLMPEGPGAAKLSGHAWLMPTVTPIDDFAGALVSRRGSDQTVALDTLALWNTEVYDYGGWFVDTSPYLTVPSGVTLVRSITNVVVSTPVAFSGRKNTLNYAGRAQCGQTDTGGSDGDNAVSGIFAVNAGDRLDYRANTNATLHASAYSWTAVEVLDPAIDYCLLSKTGNQALSAATLTAVTWDNEIAKTVPAMHDNVTQNSRLVTPAGATLCRVSAGILENNVATQLYAEIQLNGATVRGSAKDDLHSTAAAANRQVNLISAPIEVNGGVDYFEIAVSSVLANSILANSATWSCLEVLPDDHQYAVVYKSGVQSIGVSVTEVLDWGSVLADTSGFFDPAHPERLTPPAGVTRVRLSANVVSANNSGQALIDIARVRGGVTEDAEGLPRRDADTSTTENINLFGAWIDHVEGDYYIVRYMRTFTENLGDDVGTWFCIEAMDDGVVEHTMDVGITCAPIPSLSDQLVLHRSFQVEITPVTTQTRDPVGRVREALHALTMIPSVGRLLHAELLVQAMITPYMSFRHHTINFIRGILARIGLKGVIESASEAARVRGWIETKQLKGRVED